MIIGMTLFLGLGAINSQNNLLFLAFGLMLGAILVSGAYSGMTLMNIEAVRAPLGAGRVGAPMVVDYQIRNRSRWLPAFGLVVEDVPGAHATWPRFLPAPRAAVIHIPPRQSRHATATILPTARGAATFSRVRVWTTFPFGLLKKSITVRQNACALIRPERVAIAPWLTEQAMAGRGATERLSDRIGRDEEFYGLREYTYGDSLRRIAWRATARTGELVVRESYAAVFADVSIAISFADQDADPSAAPDRRDELAIKVAGTLAESLAMRASRVIILVPCVGVAFDVRPDTHAAASIGAMLDALAKIELDAVDRLRSPRSIAAQGRGVIVIHARSVDPSLAPAGAMHLSAERAAQSGQREKFLLPISSGDAA